MLHMLHTRKNHKTKVCDHKRHGNNDVAWATEKKNASKNRPKCHFGHPLDKKLSKVPQKLSVSECRKENLDLLRGSGHPPEPVQTPLGGGREMVPWSCPLYPAHPPRVEPNLAKPAALQSMPVNNATVVELVEPSLRPSTQTTHEKTLLIAHVFLSVCDDARNNCLQRHRIIRDHRRLWESKRLYIDILK